MFEESVEEKVQEILTLAVGLHQRDRLEEAEELYRRVLDLVPRHSGALHFFGVLQHQKGDSATAILLIRQALKFDPQYHDARVNLGNVLKEDGQFEDAETEYRKVVKAQGNNAIAYNNLGVVLKAQGKFDDAATAFELATQLSPQNADVFQNLGNAFKASGRIEDALTAYRQSLEIDPGRCDSHLSLGRALYAFGRIDEALGVYKKWLELEPDNPVALHMFNACDGAHVPDRCSDDFVKQTFDSFARSFDEVLERLDYHAPELVGEAVTRLSTGKDGLTVLDAGCGTGLCGKFLRAQAQRLVGIDLSPKMIDQARIAGHYDELVVGELTEYMQSQPGMFDLLVSADTLVYFGALKQVFRVAFETLKDNGLFVFTLEKGEGDMPKNGFMLNPHGRYSHWHKHATQLLLAEGFRVERSETVVLRREVRQPVAGLLFAVRKPS